MGAEGKKEKEGSEKNFAETLPSGKSTGGRLTGLVDEKVNAGEDQCGEAA